MRSPCVWEARRREVSRFSSPSRDGHPLTHTHEQTTKRGVGWRGLQIQSATDDRLVSYIRADANMGTYCVTVRPPGFI